MNQGLDEFTKLELSEPQDCVLDETDYGVLPRPAGLARSVIIAEDGYGFIAKPPTLLEEYVLRRGG
jgi:hypothetical protein